jgi:hypothetical protein
MPTAPKRSPRKDLDAQAELACYGGWLGAPTARRPDPGGIPGPGDGVPALAGREPHGGDALSEPSGGPGGARLQASSEGEEEVRVAREPAADLADHEHSVSPGGVLCLP